MSNHDRHLTCYFGILNLKGLMGIKDTEIDESTGIITSSDVILPLYSHESYKIKTTFSRNHTYKGINESIHENSSHFATIIVSEDSNNAIKKHHNKYYQKFFRKDVMWDFGDGTKVEGYSVEHSYKKPGRYKITCTFFDINRQAWVNDYSINVIVKEVLPTVLRFDKSCTKSVIPCSKVERIARIEALNSNTVDEKLNVIVERLFTKEQHNSDFVEISKKYDNVNDERFGFVDKYWTLLENQQTLYYNSNEVHSNYLKPSDVFHPKYDEIFGKFFYNEYEDKMDISLYQVIPYKNVDDNLKTITILDPNSSILDSTKETYITMNINQVYTDNQLPSDVISVGKRGWFDIFYKNDFLGNDNTFTIFYDIENQNITGELKSAPNYLNINPLGFKVNVVKNNYNNVRIGYSLDGFIRPLEGDDITAGEFFIDQHLYNTLFDGIDLDTFLFPYIPYEGTDNEYYIPKDVKINLNYKVNTINGGKNYSFINLEDFVQEIHPWFYRIPLVIKQFINIKFEVSFEDRIILMNLVKKIIPSPNNTVVPREVQSREDIDRLLNVYMSHPMWNDKPNVRDMFKALLSNGDYLTRILTTSDNFLDDTANVKRCFLSNLIATLQMMGEDVTLFESGSFEGINDLRDFVRLLSMNHTELIGHIVKEDLDIKVKTDVRGKNVGEELFINDTIRLNDNGKIDKVNDKLVIFDEGVDLIIHDRYTHDTKIVTFNSAFNGKNYPIPDENGEIQALPFQNPIKISDYEEWWGWNLLLPDSFKTINDKIITLTKKLNNKAISRNTVDNINKEIVRLKQVKSEMISGYYSFYILIPTRNSVRKGNFMDNEFVTSRIESIDDWESQWGISHEVLMKILIEHGFLGNNRSHDEDNNFDKTIKIDVTKFFEQNQIDTTIKVNGEEQFYDISGSVRISGEILDKEGNLFLVSLNKGLIANRDAFYMINNNIECFVDDEGNIENKQAEFSIIGDKVHGKLKVGLGGTIEIPQIQVSATLDYLPSVTKREVDEIITLISPVYVDDVIQSDTEFIGKLRVSGKINGIGDNTLIVEFLEGTVLYNGSPQLDENGNPYDKIILEYDDNIFTEGQQNSLHIVVDENGKIYQKIESYKIINDPNLNLYKSNWQAAMRTESVLPDGMMYGYRTALGEIRLVIEGEVSNININATSSLFMKNPDFIELPEFSEENPMIITGYYDKFEGFRIYSTYERRFGKMYFNTDVKIDNVELQLYSPRYDYNLGKCWMDGKCHFEVIVPAHKKQQSEVEVQEYPHYWHKTDRDMKLYRPYCENKAPIRMAFDIEHVFEFDTVVGDLTPATYEFDAAAYTEGIVEGIITCIFDGCIDDRISEQNDGATRDIRISIGERDDSPIRGVYAALFDIDDSYDLTTNEKCQSLVTNGITSFTVKNNYTYPCLYDDGNYVLNDEVVEIEIEFDADKDFKVKSRERFNLNITLDKDANLQHEDLVFSVGKSFSGGDFIDGEITIGLVDSQYKVIDANLIYHTGWQIICNDYNFQRIETFSDILGTALFETSVAGAYPGKPFDIIIDFTNVTFGYFDIGGIKRDTGLSTTYVISDCTVDYDGNLTFGKYPNSNVFIFQDNDVQYTEFVLIPYVNFIRKEGSMETNDGKIFLELTIRVESNNIYHSITKELDYKWTNSINDESDETLSFSENIIKTYIPDDLPKWGQHLSVNYDQPLLSDSSIPQGSGIKPEEIETGGIKLITNATLQHNQCRIFIEEVPTVVDCALTVDNNDDGKWQQGDAAEGVSLITNFDVQSEESRSGESSTNNSINCQIDYNGNIYGIPTNTITIYGGGDRTIRFKNESISTEDNPIMEVKTFNYEISGKFDVSDKGFNIFEQKPKVLGCHYLDFTKKTEIVPIPPSEVMIQYDNETSYVTDFDLTGLEDGYSLFHTHVVSNESVPYVPALRGNYNRIASDDEKSVANTFYKQLYSLNNTTDMFANCLLNDEQTKGIINSLYYNTIGGSIEIGIDNGVTSSKMFDTFIKELTGREFDASKEIEQNSMIDPNNPDAAPAVWKIKFKVNN